MPESIDRVYQAVDDQHSHLSASSRRQMLAATAATLGGMGLLSLPSLAEAQAKSSSSAANDPQTILNVAATAEVLATIINSIGFRQVNFTDRTADVTKRNIQAAAHEEFAHYNALTSSSFGGKAITTSIWIPDAVFANEQNFLNAVVFGDQVFINAYLIATTTFGQAGNGRLARVAAEFMGVEAVHRALARQSLGLLGNDRVFIKYNQVEDAAGPGNGTPGFTNVLDAVTQLEGKGIGFGKQGATPGRFYDFNQVSTTMLPPQPAGLSSVSPDKAGPAPKSDRNEEARERREERRERRQHRG